MTKEQAALLVALNAIQAGYLFLILLMTGFMGGRK